MEGKLLILLWLFYFCGLGWTRLEAVRRVFGGEGGIRIGLQVYVFQCDTDRSFELHAFVHKSFLCGVAHYKSRIISLIVHYLGRRACKRFLRHVSEMPTIRSGGLPRRSAANGILIPLPIFVNLLAKRRNITARTQRTQNPFPGFSGTV
jgi:hypothetical protein